jgi:hypothetical protein
LRASATRDNRYGSFGRGSIQRIVTWLKRIGIGIYALVAGAVGGGGGRVIVDRQDMYGDDPTNDPYSMEYDPSSKRRG